MKKYSLITLVALNIIQLHAQIQTSQDYLDYNNVKAYVTDGGIYFNKPGSNQAGYEVPKGTNLNTMYSSTFWYSGVDVNNQIHVSASNYMDNADIFPGPYSSNNSYLNQTYINNYTPSMWKVNRNEIDYHISNYNQAGYTTPNSILNWPGNGDTLLGISYQLAPFIDLDNDGKYEPTLGDYPDIKGCEAIYVIVNDDARQHTSSYGNKIGVEVHLMFYQYGSYDFKNNTTFLHKRLFNRSSNTYYDFSTSFAMDADIGNPFDDYTGSDSTRNMIYAYNGDAVDENFGNIPGYNSSPASIGIVSLNNPIIGAGYFTGQGQTYPHTDPTNASEYRNYMEGKWADGSLMYRGGLGYLGSAGVTTTPSQFMFSDNPNLSTGWSEISQMNPPGDRRSFMTINSKLFKPGDMITLDFAVLFTQNNDNIVCVNDLLLKADSVLAFYNTQIDECIDLTAGMDKISISKVSIYPNPSNGIFTLILQNKVDEISIEIYDFSGRKVMEQQYQNTKEIKIDLKETPGVYYVSVKDKTGVSIHKLIKE